jgi:hypothetical protein
VLTECQGQGKIILVTGKTILVTGKIILGTPKITSSK